ncbi:MAG: serine/threonine-protein kinase [Myxococcota bacterium]|nr:serine/threonine-protein kinase [Myxococcota bacterium]
MKQAGDIVGRFELRGLVGEGGLAHVYLARHRTLGTDHAIKFLSAPSRQMTLRLLQEGRIQARLRHPNIVSVTDVVETEHEVGLVMEFVQGFSLEECIRDGGAMDLDEALVLFSQILGAVGTAHTAGILHRDLKPANVLLTASGDSVIAKVSDFGIAKFGQTQGTGKGPMGTPGYMAPEQIKDASLVTRRADIFALGALLYEMLSGKPAFPDTDLRGVLNATAEGAFTPLSVHNPSLPRRVIEAIERALDPTPEGRFDNVEAFATALGVPVLINQPPEPVSLAPPGDAPPVRHTIAPEVELAPEEEDDPEAELGDPMESLRALRKPLRKPSLDPEPGLHEPPRRPRPSLTPAPRRTPAPRPRPTLDTPRRSTLPPELHPERERLVDARDTMDPMARFGLDDPRIQTDPELEKAAEPAAEPQEVETTAPDTLPPSAPPEEPAPRDEPVAMSLASVVGNLLRFVLVPLLLIMGFGWMSGVKGSEEVNTAHLEFQAAQEQLDRALADQVAMVQQLTEMGATAPSLKALAADARDPKDPVQASRKLSEATLDQLRVLPPTKDPAEIQRRREMELKVRDLERIRSRHDQAFGEWEDASHTLFGQVAIRTGMATGPKGTRR